MSPDQQIDDVGGGQRRVRDVAGAHLIERAQELQGQIVLVYSRPQPHVEQRVGPVRVVKLDDAAGLNLEAFAHQENLATVKAGAADDYRVSGRANHLQVDSAFQTHGGARHAEVLGRFNRDVQPQVVR